MLAVREKYFYYFISENYSGIVQKISKILFPQVGNFTACVKPYIVTYKL